MGADVKAPILNFLPVDLTYFSQNFYLIQCEIS